jgi:hypothetical protein
MSFQNASETSYSRLTLIATFIFYCSCGGVQQNGTSGVKEDSISKEGSGCYRDVRYPELHSLSVELEDRSVFDTDNILFSSRRAAKCKKLDEYASTCYYNHANWHIEMLWNECAYQGLLDLVYWHSTTNERVTPNYILVSEVRFSVCDDFGPMGEKFNDEFVCGKAKLTGLYCDERP